MSRRWKILAVLFTARATMGFQFEAVPALAPLLREGYGVGLADIGLLIGLYLSPGIVIALPGGAIGRLLGDKTAVAGSMVLMVAGGLLVTLVPAWEAQIAGRVVAGTGAVVLNVLMSKMVADWFAGPDLATAMGVFVNSWPVGIALALLSLPSIAGSVGLDMTMAFVAASVAFGLVLFLIGYQEPPTAGGASAALRESLDGALLACVIVAGSIWALYNAALGMIFGFGPAMLAERGWDAAAAGSTTSVVLWLVALSVPLGGLIADRLRQRDVVLALGLASFGALMLVAPVLVAAAASRTILLFVALGLFGGLAAGPIMSLPADVLRPGNRALGMGVFFSVYYLGIFVGPFLAGVLAERTGDAGVTFSLGGVLLIACIALLGLFRVMKGRAAGAVAAS